MSTTTMTETREKSKERIGVRGVVQIGMLSAICLLYTSPSPRDTR